MIKVRSNVRYSNTNNVRYIISFDKEILSHIVFLYRYMRKTTENWRVFILDKWASFPDHLILVVEKPIHYVSSEIIHIIVAFSEVFPFVQYVCHKTSFSKSDKTPFISSAIQHMYRIFFLDKYTEIIVTMRLAVWQTAKQISCYKNSSNPLFGTNQYFCFIIYFTHYIQTHFLALSSIRVL